jgi:serine/arginine repetitive matrix protein 1
LQAEVDRIANEIQKKKEIEKEMRELEREKLKKMVMLTHSRWS